MSVRVEFRWPEELLGAVDAAAGDVPRSVWVRRAVEVALARADGSLRAAAEREVAEKFGLHPPAEQPESDAQRRMDPKQLVDAVEFPEGPPLLAELLADPEPEWRSVGCSCGADTIPGSVHAPNCDDEPVRRVSPPKPIPPRVPFRRDVKPFPRGDK